MCAYVRADQARSTLLDSCVAGPRCRVHFAAARCGSFAGFSIPPLSGARVVDGVDLSDRRPLTPEVAGSSLVAPSFSTALPDGSFQRGFRNRARHFGTLPVPPPRSCAGACLPLRHARSRVGRPAGRGGRMTRRVLAAAAFTLITLLLPRRPASGVASSTTTREWERCIDDEGTGVPRVDGLVCTGSYAGESKNGQNDVFLTAGHCLFGPPASTLYVSFENNASVTDIHAPIANRIPVQSAHQMPCFGHDLGDLCDLGILLLPKDSVPAGIAPVRLAPAGVSRHLEGSRVEVPRGRDRRLWRDADLGTRWPHAVRVRRQAALRDVDHSRSREGIRALQPERRDRDGLGVFGDLAHRRSTRQHSGSSRSRPGATSSATQITTTTASTRRRRASSSGSS